MWNGDYCDYVFIPTIGLVASYRSTHDLVSLENILELLDAPNGNVIDLDVERIPYFPDYTLDGLFPQMDRTEWLNLEAILQ